MDREFLVKNEKGQGQMKVLLIGHNPTSSYECMGKTFVSLFSCFDKKEGI